MLGNDGKGMDDVEADDQELQRLLADERDLSRRIELLESELSKLQFEVAQQPNDGGTELQPLQQSCENAAEAVERILNSIPSSETTNNAHASSERVEKSLSAVTVPKHCIPIRADVLTFDWKTLYKSVKFDVIVMDPPWQLATNQPTRGVAIAYQQMPDVLIQDLPISKLSTDGFIFIWVINNKFLKALELMHKWGYKHVDDVVWVKQTVNRRMAKGHGYYLQHAKETCLVGVKGKPTHESNVASDVIYAERRGQSQKPEELYEMIEALVPNGRYLEIFGRRNNLRNHWVTLGNEL